MEVAPTTSFSRLSEVPSSAAAVSSATVSSAAADSAAEVSAAASAADVSVSVVVDVPQPVTTAESARERINAEIFLRFFVVIGSFHI